MASLLAPWGGHPAQNVALIAAQFSNLKLTIQPPDADATVGRGSPPWCMGPPPSACSTALPTSRPHSLTQEAVLTTADGQKVAQSEAIARYGAPPTGRRQPRPLPMPSLLPSSAWFFVAD